MFSARLVSALNQRQSGSAATISVDGFHFDDRLMSSLGLAGAGNPEAYDTAGLSNMLRRVRANAERTIALPEFDTALGVSRASARLLPQSTEVLVVDGSYLLSETPHWLALRHFFDVTVMMAAEETDLRRRLLHQWTEAGLSRVEAADQIERFDLRFGQYVRDTSGGADFMLG